MIWLRLLIGYVVIMTVNWLISSVAGRQVSLGEALAIAFAGIVIGVSQQLSLRTRAEKSSSADSS
jgi:hypothetical protein